MFKLRRKIRLKANTNPAEVLIPGDPDATLRNLEKVFYHKPKRAVKLFEAALKSPDEKVRRRAIVYFNMHSLSSHYDKIRSMTKDPNKNVRVTAYSVMSDLAKYKFRFFFLNFFWNPKYRRTRGFEINKGDHVLRIKLEHTFPNYTHISKRLGQVFLEVVVDGKPQCVLQSNGITIDAIQGHAGIEGVGKYFETVVKDYLELFKPILSEENPALLESHYYFDGGPRKTGYKKIRDMFFNKEGVLNFNRKRVQAIFGKSGE